MSILNSFSLEGKVALVTGGAGMYGRQIAMALAQAGAATNITSRHLDQLPVMEESYAESGVTVKAHNLDQEHEESILALRDKLMAEHGRIDILVNNAVARTMGSWNDPLEAFAQSMQINATGLFSLTRAFGDIMAEQGSGSIINIGSIQGMVGPDATLYKDMGFHGMVPDYFFHKGGMINFTRFVASYYGPKNVRCNCVSPGGLASHRTPEAFVERYSDRTLLGRMANETDLMGSIVFLASEASVYLTGVNLPVDGGYTAK
ncbi:SDR family oxidoreductase [Paenibacillus eucommiae]|uniref:NAD(P)-dependent dehydrogenase (Short-subunit alcohol dehydrogenase family) n=1 Tax=Paenibacillus eucommiae TaxID=1355755 RepID=A0ABS4IZW7_9BACL|nr:SDR family oxidoreductase [Paenibacillus eucommiae]MBP1993140.1 NAD(P)-dependent dehydrogenase (short-subunit alcohol dehydrogenase family) [Paenibacillus eucommiae]